MAFLQYGSMVCLFYSLEVWNESTCPETNDVSVLHLQIVRPYSKWHLQLWLLLGASYAYTSTHDDSAIAVAVATNTNTAQDSLNPKAYNKSPVFASMTKYSYIFQCDSVPDDDS